MADWCFQIEFKMLLRFDEFAASLVWLQVSHVGVRHGVRANDVAMADDPAHLVVSHHQRTGFGWEARLKLLLDASYEFFLGLAAQLAAHVASRKEALLPIR